jgi:hypothetical protein
MDAAYALSEVDVAGHYCDAFGMNGTQISVLKHLYYVGFGCFLYRQQRQSGESQI